MKKAVLYILILSFVLVYLKEGVYAINPGEKPYIISREVWEANSLYNDIEGQYWQNILTARKEQRENYTASPEQIEKSKQKTEAIEEYLYGNFLDQFTSVETLYYHQKTGKKLAWPIKYTDYVDSIIIHHTHSEHKNGLEGVRDIHKYHSLSNQWGDIGYNYLIGYDGEIFEGKEGGAYVVGAHSGYNNFGTVGIAVIGDYHHKAINEKQYESLESLVQYLTYFYGIDLSNDRYYHMNCSGVKCDTFYLETYLDSVMAGHRDSGHTNCPGDQLYAQMQQVRNDNLDFTAGFTLKKRSQKNADTENISNTYDTALVHEIRKRLQKYDALELAKIQIQLEKIQEDRDTDNKTKELVSIALLAIRLESQD